MSYKWPIYESPAPGFLVGDFAGERIVFLTGATVAGSVLWADYAIDFLLAYLLGLVFQVFRDCADAEPLRMVWNQGGDQSRHGFAGCFRGEVGMCAWMAPLSA